MAAGRGAAERARREKVRLAAAEMTGAGASDREAARRFRVSRMPVNRWRRAPACGRPGGAGVRGAGDSKRKLTAAQVAELEAVLDAGPAAAGYADQCRTWPGPRTRPGGGPGRSTRWPGWMCCRTGSGGARRSRRDGRRSGMRRRLLGGGRPPGRS